MPTFRKALLLYNPVSGAHHERRKLQMAEVEKALRATGAEVEVEPTRQAGSAGQQAREAIETRGCDAIFACGGDGTIFDTLQGVVNSGAMLGVIPLGTGNILAKDLALPGDATLAVRQLLTYEPRRIAVGLIACNGGAVKRYFTVCAGVGAHAEMIYRSSSQAKQAQGQSAYYTIGFQLLLNHEFVPFEMEYTDLDGETHREECFEMLAMRVSSFGGLLSRFRPGGRLDAPYLQVALLRNSSRWAVFRYLLHALLNGERGEMSQLHPSDVSFVRARHIMTRPIASGSEQIRVQADGEALGMMPAELTLVPDALNLLMP